MFSLQMRSNIYLELLLVRLTCDDSRQGLGSLDVYYGDLGKQARQ